MDESRLDALERKVEALSKTVEELSARLDQRAGAPPGGTAEAAASAPETSVLVAPSAGLPMPPEIAKAVGELGAEPGELLSRSVSLVGRSFLVFGGAFLIRAITDRDLVPHAVGVGLGVAFAALWVVLGWRAAAKGLALSSAFHLGCAALAGFPLIIETSTRLGLVPPPVAAALVSGFSGLMVLAAWQTRRRLGAWLGVVGGVATVLLVLRQADTTVGLTLALLFLALCTLWLEDTREWSGLRWMVAPVLDLIVLRKVFSIWAHPEWADQLTGAVALAQLTVALYLGALAWRTWRRVRNTGLFEVVQTTLVVAVGVSVAARIEPTHGGITTIFACVALLLAAFAVVTTARANDRPNHGIDVWFYGVLGLALVLAGGLLLTRGPLLTVLWSGLALALAVLGRRRRPLMLWIFSGVLGLAIAVAGGVMTLLSSAFAGDPARGVEVSLPVVAVIGVLLACWVITAWRVPEVRGPRVAAGGLLLLALLGVASLAVAALRPALGAAPDPAIVVLVRTLVLVGGALGLGLARRAGPPELGWVAWASLGFAGLKLLVQDLPSSRASTLFISFVAFGLAIIVLPRLIRARNAKPNAA